MMATRQHELHPADQLIQQKFKVCDAFPGFLVSALYNLGIKQVIHNMFQDAKAYLFLPVTGGTLMPTPRVVAFSEEKRSSVYSPGSKAPVGRISRSLWR